MHIRTNVAIGILSAVAAARNSSRSLAGNLTKNATCSSCVDFFSAITTSLSRVISRGYRGRHKKEHR